MRGVGGRVEVWRRRGKGVEGRVQRIDGIRTYEAGEWERKKMHKNLISTSTCIKNNQELKVHDPFK